MGVLFSAGPKRKNANVSTIRSRGQHPSKENPVPAKIKKEGMNLRKAFWEVGFRLGKNEEASLY